MDEIKREDEIPQSMDEFVTEMKKDGVTDAKTFAVKLKAMVYETPTNIISIYMLLNFGGSSTHYNKVSPFGRLHYLNREQEQQRFRNICIAM